MPIFLFFRFKERIISMSENKTRLAQKPASHSAKKPASRKKKKKLRNNTGILCGAILGAFVVTIGGAYCVGRAYYSGKFLADTYINGVNVSGLDYEEACKKTGADVTPKKLSFTTVDGKQIDISTADFDYKRNSKDEVKKLLGQVKHSSWFSGLISKSEYTYTENATYDSDKLEKLIKDAKWGDAETADATLELTDDGYVINKEVQGNKVTDMDQLIYLAETALSNGEFDVTLTADSGVYTQPEVTSDDYKEQCDARNKVFDMSITYDFDYTTETLTGKELLKILDVDDEGNYKVDEDKAMEYVEKLAKKYDTYDTERKFKATLQGKITVPTSTDAKYGWWIDKEKTRDALVEMLEEGESVASVDPIYYSTGYYDFTGVESARSKDDDIGDTYIEIDLSNQELWYYKKGKLEYDCYIVSGQTTSAARTTLPGVYKLWAKDTNYRMKDSNADGDKWDVTCNFWNNVSLCGIGLHDSVWRNGAFGGSIYKWNGSHGCINMPYDGAKYIYDNVELGTPVVMYY